MISDERLREAAQQAEKAFLASLPEPKDSKAAFSPAFERKMKKLIKRIDHPIVYWIQKSVACLVLILLLGGGSVLALSTEARAAFVGWLREVYESWFVYHYTGEDAITTENTIYYPGWLPDGYELIAAPEPGPHTISIYENQAKDTIIFNCFKNSESMAIQIGKENAFVEKVQIDDAFADLYVDSKSGETNHLIWEDPENKVIFWLVSTLDSDYMVKIAESIELMD